MKNIKTLIILLFIFLTLISCKNHKSEEESPEYIKNLLKYVNSENLTLLEGEEKKELIDELNKGYNLSKIRELSKINEEDREKIFFEKSLVEQDYETYKSESGDVAVFNPDKALVYFKSSKVQERDGHSSKIDNSLIEDLKKDKIIPLNYEPEISSSKTELVLFPKLNDGIINYLNKIEIKAEDSSEKLTYFLMRHEVLVKEGEVVPKISKEEALRIAKEHAFKTGAKDIQIKDIKLIISTYEDESKLKDSSIININKPTDLFNKKTAFFAYEVHCEFKNEKPEDLKGEILYIDAKSSEEFIVIPYI